MELLGDDRRQRVEGSRQRQVGDQREHDHRRHGGVPPGEWAPTDESPRPARAMRDHRRSRWQARRCMQAYAAPRTPRRTVPPRRTVAVQASTQGQKVGTGRASISFWCRTDGATPLPMRLAPVTSGLAAHGQSYPVALWEPGITPIVSRDLCREPLRPGPPRSQIASRAARRRRHASSSPGSYPGKSSGRFLASSPLSTPVAWPTSIM